MPFSLLYLKFSEDLVGNLFAALIGPLAWWRRDSSFKVFPVFILGRGVTSRSDRSWFDGSLNCWLTAFFHTPSEQWLVPLLLAQHVFLYQSAPNLEHVDQVEALSNPGELACPLLNLTSTICDEHVKLAVLWCASVMWVIAALADVRWRYSHSFNISNQGPLLKME